MGGGLPPAWEWKAANSLYRFDATVDEGAAGRSEVQEGQAGCSGRSGLATGTENRREMKRVKRRETLQQGGGEGGEPQGRAKGVPPGDTSVVGQPGQEDIRQQMLLVGVGCMERAGHLALGRGRKGESAKATASTQRRG